ncbi:GrpB family protein [Tropicimonas sp. TH_r6]|uniref:GrpB family protein n=1 Tax=Tropicimonas sp. TH_r6 TaxID=3082085 RepID=UPI0029546828|nr:GrpB family protein [Tropicimonas sp. TH_r6]MDV7143824.1 GrpB family protein [Tropicimonas sp. TH_r6]
MRIEIASYDPTWPEKAAREAERWKTALGDALIEVHHIGSTSVPNLAAKPVLDLIPVIAEGVDLDSLQPAVHAMGYQWLGENGLARRRYCRRSSPTTGARLVQAHIWTEGDSEIRRHLAFRDLLRADPLMMGAYETLKRHCASHFRDNSEAYCNCKATWIATAEAKALRALEEDGT